MVHFWCSIETPQVNGPNGSGKWSKRQRQVVGHPYENMSRRTVSDFISLKSGT